MRRLRCGASSSSILSAAATDGAAAGSYIGVVQTQTGQNDPAQRIDPSPLVIVEGAHALHARLRPADRRQYLL